MLKNRTARIATAVLLLVALLIMSALVLLMSRPLIDRTFVIINYFLSPAPKSQKFLESDLNAEILTLLSSGLSPKTAERLFVHRVPSWFPMAMDNPESRMETVRQIADSVPEQTLDWLPLHGGVRDGYILFLSSLASEAKSRGELQSATGDSINLLLSSRSRYLKDINARRPSSEAEMHESSLAKNLFSNITSWFTPLVDPKILSEATNLALETMVSNPGDSYSALPPIAKPDAEQLDAWFSTSSPPRRKVIASSSVAMTISAPSLDKSVQEQQTLAKAPSSANEVKQVTASLYARDWQIFKLQRSWLNLELLEKYRRDWNLLVDVSWLFRDDGPLSHIPYAIVVGKDILYEVVLSDDDDVSTIKDALERKTDLTLRVGSTTLIIAPDSVRLDAGNRVLSIAPTQTRANVLAVVTMRY